MRTTLLLVALAVVGCGGDGSIKVGNQSLTIRDQGYFYSDSHDYCSAGGAGQMLLDFVDYNFICDPGNAPQKDPEGCLESNPRADGFALVAPGP